MMQTCNQCDTVTDGQSINGICEDCYNHDLVSCEHCTTFTYRLELMEGICPDCLDQMWQEEAKQLKREWQRGLL